MENFNDFKKFKKLYNLGEVDFMYHTDSDTVADEYCLYYLLRAITSDDDLVGVYELPAKFPVLKDGNVSVYCIHMSQHCSYNCWNDMTPIS